MARRQLLSNEAWAARLAPAVDDREVIRHYTLSEDDLDAIMRKRLDTSRLGYALALCLMRYPGRSLEQGEALPVQIIGYVARQLGMAPNVFDNSSERDKERRKQLAEVMRRFGYRPFDRASLKDLIGWLTPAAQVTRTAEPLIDMMRCLVCQIGVRAASTTGKAISSAGADPKSNLSTRGTPSAAICGRTIRIASRRLRRGSLSQASVSAYHAYHLQVRYELRARETR